MKARALVAVLMVCTTGCMSYSSDESHNPKVPDGSRILVECAGDQTAYLFDEVFVRSEVVVGRGMKHDRRRGRWERFEGEISMSSVSGMYVMAFDAKRTIWLTLGMFIHAVIARMLCFHWSVRGWSGPLNRSSKLAKRRFVGRAWQCCIPKEEI